MIRLEKHCNILPCPHHYLFHAPGVPGNEATHIIHLQYTHIYTYKQEQATIGDIKIMFQGLLVGDTSMYGFVTFPLTAT